MAWLRISYQVRVPYGWHFPFWLQKEFPKLRRRAPLGRSVAICKLIAKPPSLRLALRELVAKNKTIKPRDESRVFQTEGVACSIDSLGYCVGFGSPCIFTRCITPLCWMRRSYCPKPSALPHSSIVQNGRPSNARLTDEANSTGDGRNQTGRTRY